MLLPQNNSHTFSGTTHQSKKMVSTLPHQTFREKIPDNSSPWNKPFLQTKSGNIWSFQEHERIPTMLFDPKMHHLIEFVPRPQHKARLSFKCIKNCIFRTTPTLEGINFCIPILARNATQKSLYLLHSLPKIRIRYTEYRRSTTKQIVNT